MIHKKLDASECFTEQTSAHTGGVTPSSSHSDNQSDQSLTGFLYFSIFSLK